MTDSATPQVHLTGRNVLGMPGHQVHALYKLRVDVFVNEQRFPRSTIRMHSRIRTTSWRTSIQVVASFPMAQQIPDLRCAWLAPAVSSAPEEQHLGRLCVSADMRGYGIAHQLVQEALEVCISRAAALDPATQKAIVKIEAQTYLDDFYKTYGFVEAGEKFSAEGIEHVEMHLDLDEYKMRIAQKDA